MAAKKKTEQAAEPTAAAEPKARAPGELTGKQRRKLRALGHHLSAVVQVGDEGVTPGVVAATSQALEDHELIKIRIADEREGRAKAVETLAKETGALVAQELGRTALLFKKRKKKSKIQLD